MDSDGSLTHLELAADLGSLGLPNDEQIHNLQSNIDLNGNGSIEFQVLVEKILQDMNEVSTRTAETNTMTSHLSLSHAHEIPSPTRRSSAKLKWLMATMFTAFSAVLSLLSLSYVVKNGGMRPDTLFRHHNVAYVVYLLAVMVTFHAAAVGIIFVEEIIDNFWTCGLSFIGLVISFTLLTSAVMPPNFGMLPWLPFAITVSSAIFRHVINRYMNGDQRSIRET